MKILVIQMKMIGDVLAGSVVCEELKRRHPDADIHYLVYQNTRQVVDNHPAIDQLILFNPQKDAGVGSFWRFIQKIKARRYDVIYDLYCKTQSQLISFFSGVPKRISYYKWYSAWCYSKTIHRHTKRVSSAGPAIENRLRLVYHNKALPKVLPLPKIYLTTDEQKTAEKQLNKAELSKQDLIMVSALGSQVNKTWPLEYTAELLDYLVAHYDVMLLFNYLPYQRREAERLFQYCHNDTQAHIYLDLYAEDLRQFLAILNHCRVIIGNEGGAINMGKALDCPSFSLYAPWINPGNWGIGEDGVHHSAVHLRDFELQLYDVGKYKKLKPQAVEMYQKLTPKRVLPEFSDFCARNLADLSRH